MSNKVIEKIEKDQLKDHPEFRAGDTVCLLYTSPSPRDE